MLSWCEHSGSQDVFWKSFTIVCGFEWCYFQLQFFTEMMAEIQYPVFILIRTVFLGLERDIAFMAEIFHHHLRFWKSVYVKKCMNWLLYQLVSKIRPPLVAWLQILVWTLWSFVAHLPATWQVLPTFQTWIVGRCEQGIGWTLSLLDTSCTKFWAFLAAERPYLRKVWRRFDKPNSGHMFFLGPLDLEFFIPCLRKKQGPRDPCPINCPRKPL